MSKDKKTEKSRKNGKKDEKTNTKTIQKDKQSEVAAKLNEELEQAQQKNEELNDKYLRLYSEFDNFRKRTLREKSELVKTASEETISSLLPVLDDMERAISVEQAREGDDSPLEGLKLIYNKFYGILQQRGLQVIEPIGQPFDVDFHEAITEVPAPSEDMKGKVIDQVMKGYMLNGKVIRYARVVVGA